MTDYTVSSDNSVKQWASRFFAEYVRENRFARFMGNDANKIITVVEDLTKKPGEQISLPLITRMTGAGVTGNTKLEDAEEALNNYAHTLSVEVIRNAVLITQKEQQTSAYDDFKAAKMMLKHWIMEHLRDQIIAGLKSVGGVAYGSATEAQKDAWLDNNTDRFIGGVNTVLSTSAPAGGATYDHSATLAAIASTEKLSAAVVSLAKRVAKTADPHIRPIKTTEDEEWYVMFANSLSFRDLKEDSTMSQANREAWTRGAKNPLFRDGDLIYDGVIIREVPEIGVTGAVGTGSAQVAPNFLCGAQAVGVAYARKTTPIRETRDYGFRSGVGVMEYRGTEKLLFNDKDHGVVTIFSAAAADA